MPREVFCHPTQSYSALGIIDAVTGFSSVQGPKTVRSGLLLEFLDVLEFLSGKWWLGLELFLTSPLLTFRSWLVSSASLPVTGSLRPCVGPPWHLCYKLPGFHPCLG